MLASPPEVIAASRTELVPAATCTVKLLVAHVVHAPVASKAKPDCTTAPLTLMSAGRFAVPPLAYRTATVAGPAAAEWIVNCTAEPTALVVSQKPLPE